MDLEPEPEQEPAPQLAASDTRVAGASGFADLAPSDGGRYPRHEEWGCTLPPAVVLGSCSAVAWRFGEWLLQVAPGQQLPWDSSNPSLPPPPPQLLFAHADGTTKLTVILLPGEWPTAPVDDENGLHEETAARRRRRRRRRNVRAPRPIVFVWGGGGGSETTVSSFSLTPAAIMCVVLRKSSLRSQEPGIKTALSCTGTRCPAACRAACATVAGRRP